MEIGNYLVFFGFAAVIAVIVTVIILKERKRKLKENTVYVANTRFLTSLPEFISQYKKYRTSLIAAATLLAMLIATMVFLSGRIVTATTITPQQYNRDIMLCLDVSTSMSSANEAVVDTYIKLLEQFEGERVSLVVWNATAYQQFPFTDDYGYLTEQLESMKEIFNELSVNPDNFYYYFYGTLGAIDSVDSSLAGDGLSTCALKFDKQDTTEERYRSIIFATDNEVMGRENITLRQATTLLQERDITLYTLNPFPDTTFAAELKEATESIDGRYYSLRDSSAVQNIVEKINEDQINSFPGDKQRVIFDNPNVFLAILLFLIPGYLFFTARSRN